MDIATPFLDAVILVPFMVLCVRLTGLRAFSKMSSYDFAVTIAFGSVLGGTVLSPTTNLWQGMTAMTALFVVQWAIGFARSQKGSVERAIDNTPLLLMSEGRILEANLAKARVTESDIRAKLREANVLDYDAVRAVVMETTGDVSVLHGSRLSDALIEDVSRNK